MLPVGSTLPDNNSYHKKMQDKKEKSKQLARCLGLTIKNYRQKELQKSMTKLADEYELHSGTLSKVENAVGACKFETVWEIAEAMNLKPSELVKLVEDNLGINFKFIDE